SFYCPVKLTILPGSRSRSAAASYSDAVQFIFIRSAVLARGHDSQGFDRAIFGSAAAQVILFVSSLYFYAFGQSSYVLLLLCSILVNWGMARLVFVHRDSGRARLFLWFGLVLNILFLGSFKYINFLLGTLAPITGGGVALPNWDFPLGISFFTLTQ